MSREIKFRSYRDGDFEYWGTGDKKPNAFWGNFRRCGGDIEQYTGLKDKNGREIYEGDIFHVIDGMGNECVGKVHYYAPWGRIIIGENLTLTGPLARLGEIIGNIHGNPELLND